MDLWKCFHNSLTLMQQESEPGTALPPTVLFFLFYSYSFPNLRATRCAEVSSCFMQIIISAKAVAKCAVCLCECQDQTCPKALWGNSVWIAATTPTAPKPWW